MKVLVGTSNRGKLQEIGRLLSGLDLETIGLCDAGIFPEPEETGATFGENALIKARHYHAISGLVAMADDSGLEVEELAGAPGVRSARYAGPGATDRDRVEKLLGELKDTPEGRRAARFVCAVAVVWPEGQRLFLAEVSGHILRHPVVQNGFGYDPVFYYPPLGKTFAQISMDQKTSVSHRGKAFGRLARWLSSEFKL